MKRLKSWGGGKSVAKAEAAAQAASRTSSDQWPTPVPEEQEARQRSQLTANSGVTHTDTYVNFSDDEIRAMEESAMEYAITQSQAERYLRHTALRQLALPSAFKALLAVCCLWCCS